MKIFRPVITEKGYTFPYLFDEAQKVYPEFGATRTPHTFVLQKRDGNFYVEYIGSIDDNTKDGSKATVRYVEDAVDALIKGEKPAISSTKAVGCTIKSNK